MEQKIYCEEVLKEGFDDLPTNEIRKMIGWCEYNDKEKMWDIRLIDGDGYHTKNQDTAEILSNQEMIKAMLMRNL